MGRRQFAHCFAAIGLKRLAQGRKQSIRPRNGKKCGPQRCTLGPGGSECRTVDVCVSPGSHGKTVLQPPVVRPSRFGSHITKPLFAWTHSERKEDNEMNEDVFNGSIRKFLKTRGVSGRTLPIVQRRAVTLRSPPDQDHRRLKRHRGQYFDSRSSQPDTSLLGMLRRVTCRKHYGVNQ